MSPTEYKQPELEPVPEAASRPMSLASPPAHTSPLAWGTGIGTTSDTTGADPVHRMDASRAASSSSFATSHSTVPQLDIHADRPDPFNSSTLPNAAQAHDRVQSASRGGSGDSGGRASTISAAGSRASRSGSLQATRPAPSPPAHAARADSSASPRRARKQSSTDSGNDSSGVRSILASGPASKQGSDAAASSPSAIRRRTTRPPPAPIASAARPRAGRARLQERHDTGRGRDSGSEEEEGGRASIRSRRLRGGRPTSAARKAGESESSSGSPTEVEVTPPGSYLHSRRDARVRRRDMADDEADSAAAARMRQAEGEGQDEDEEDPDDRSLRQELSEDGVRPSAAIWAAFRAPSPQSAVDSINSRVHDQRRSGGVPSLRDAEEGRGGAGRRNASHTSHTSRASRASRASRGAGAGAGAGASRMSRAHDSAHPPRPHRRPTLASTVSYTSTIVVTSIFADIKNDAIAMAGEFVGTILFLITSLGAAQAVASMRQSGDSGPDPEASTTERLIATFYRAFASGMALYGCASIFYRFTGSIFNPSVSLALAICRVIRPVRFILVSASQMAGGVVASYILYALLPGQSNINLELSASASIAQGLFIETFATTTLILAVLMLGVEKHLVTPHAPLGFGFTLFAAMLFAMPYTGAGINVARAFGTALIEGFQPYHWIYWIGPTIGAILASAFYEFLRFIQYWQVNPGQDSTQPITGPPELGKNFRREKGMKKRDILSPTT